ncbi:DUF4856 domain-containing protein [Marinagarivorans algicola]|uniref:DUF4856 domain-containing protein n=1 Tax=Marinagarivorans algicola TaxID=1513270 RepID=UPI0009EB6917|nr:DUF4856 domain-containing protein [Marinagarivorans algicola]
MKKTALALAIALSSIALVGCGSSSSGGGSPTTSSTASSTASSTTSSSADSSSSAAVVNEYAFSVEGDSTVSYTGQTARHVMIEDIKSMIGSMTKGAETGITDRLMTLYQNPSNSQDGEAILLKTGDFTLDQTVYSDISAGKNLQGKIAGGYIADGTPSGETGTLIGEFVGSGMPAGTLPSTYVEAMFTELGALAAASSDVMVSVAGEPQAVTAPYISAQGVDYQQLVQKFLLMAVGFSQGVNDYLKPSRDFANELGKAEGKEDKPYSTAEHHFDEGFGYFGAIPTYSSYTDAEISTASYIDEDASGSINLKNEYNFGQSINCAKRDKGTASNANPTDFTGDISAALYAGRTIVAEATAAGSLSAEQEDQLRTQIKQVALTWEMCIAATVVHYINDVKSDIAKFDGTDYVDVAHFTDLAKHWSEMKGFALGLQFSPYSPLRTEMGTFADITYGSNTATLEDVLTWMGVAPVLADATDADKESYVEALDSARAVLQAAYDFDADNVANW